MNKKGFTLTELIVVIVIIGLVLLIVIPVSSNIMEKNAEEKGTFYVQTLENAVNTYCDMYNADEVTMKKLEEEKLFSKNSGNVTGSIDDSTTFIRTNGEVKILNNEQEDNLKITVEINGKNYNCDKNSCT